MFRFVVTRHVKTLIVIIQSKSFRVQCSNNYNEKSLGFVHMATQRPSLFHGITFMGIEFLSLMNIPKEVHKQEWKI